MTTLITGATGFVGSAVARSLLARGHQLRCLVRAGSDRANLAGLPVDTIAGDLLDPASLTRAVAGCTALFHIAADYRLWVPNPAEMRRANIDGTIALLRAAQAAGVAKIVYCSSVAALGLTGTTTPADETTPTHTPTGHYKQSKYAAEQAVLALIRDENNPCVVVNPSTPVGPRDIKPTPTGKMIRDAAAGRMPAYLDTGLNIVHVDDVAEGHVLAYERGAIGQRYILGGQDFAMADLLGLINRLTGRRGGPVRLSEALLWPLAMASEALARGFGFEPIVTRDHLRMARQKMFFSSAKAARDLGYHARPAEAAITDAIAWFAAHP